MKDRTRNILVGCTALAGLVGVATMLMLFGSLPSLLEKGYTIHVMFSDANGLTNGSRVRLNGIDVGSITTVDLQYPPRQGVLVTAKINDGVVLIQGVSAHVQAPLFGGSPDLELELPTLKPAVNTGEATQESATQETVKQVAGPAVAKDFVALPTDGSATLEGEAPSIASQLAKELKGVLEEPMKRLDVLNANFAKLSDQWTQAGRNIKELTRPLTDAEIKSGKSNLATAITHADQRLTEMETAIAGINKWVADEKLHSDMVQTMANARSITEKLDKGVTQVTEVAQSFKESLDRLSRKYAGVADDLSGAIAAARQAIDQARTGQGTVGKLINNPALYNNLNDAVVRVDQAMVEFRLLLEKWKKEGIPIQY